jgi:hypothetical protein
MHWPASATCFLQANHGVVHWQIVINAQHWTIKAHEEEMARGLGIAAVLSQCDKSIYDQGTLLAKSGITIEVQVEAPGHSKWWHDKKMGSNKRYYQQCMFMFGVVLPRETNGVRQMLSAK